MARDEFFALFLEELSDLYDAEQQLVKALPKVAKAASTPELKEAINHHLEETKNQVKRLEKIFTLLHKKPEGETCKAMQGLIKEMDALLADHEFSGFVKDAAIISKAQRVEHYEIAAYGVAKTFAKQLEESKIADILNESLQEEGNADKKLSSIAEGSIFSSGINASASKRK
jgi:ferritin-like metal-binding protein YciE